MTLTKNGNEITYDFWPGGVLLTDGRHTSWLSKAEARSDIARHLQDGWTKVAS